MQNDLLTIDDLFGDVKAVLDSFVWAIGFSLESGQHVELEELRNAELKLFHREKCCIQNRRWHACYVCFAG